MVFYTMIEDLQTLAEAARLPRTNQMMVSYGLGIIQRTGDMEKGLSEWHELDADDQTWRTFKRHFNNAYRALKKVRGTVIKNTPFHEANSMAQQLHDDISDLRSEFRNSMHLITQENNVPTSSPQSSLTHSANSTTNDNLLQMILQLQQQMLNLHNSTPAPSQPAPKPTRKFIRNHTDKYCWTHGRKRHESKQCKNKKDGHKDNATFSNKMGGSLQYCKEADNKDQNTK